MKILRVKFDNIVIFEDSFDLDFTAPDKVMQDSGAYNIYGSMNTLHTISIVGINAVGKTTALRLARLATEVVLNNVGLNEGFIPSVFINESTKNDGVLMTVYFYKDNKVFKLLSTIKMDTSVQGAIRFYYSEEILMEKNVSSVSNKANIFTFNKNNTTNKIVRSKLGQDLLKLLKDDDSIAIIETRDNKTSIKTLLEDGAAANTFVTNSIDSKILNVFDENLATLERVKDKDGIRVVFKNNNLQVETNQGGLIDIISAGTIKGQNIIKNAIIALKSGGYLLIDELENHMNKELVKMIINIFNKKDVNKNGATLLFTTHYAEILDSFDRKDNIYVMTRNKDLFSKIQRYSDLIKRNELKKSEVILSNYIKGTAPKALSIIALEEYIYENI